MNTLKTFKPTSLDIRVTVEISPMEKLHENLHADMPNSEKASPTETHKIHARVLSRHSLQSLSELGRALHETQRAEPCAGVFMAHPTAMGKREDIQQCSKIHGCKMTAPIAWTVACVLFRTVLIGGRYKQDAAHKQWIKEKNGTPTHCDYSKI